MKANDPQLTREQLANVQAHADRILREAAAHGVFPTPVDQILAAAKLTVVDDDVIDESALRRFMGNLKAGTSNLIKSALSKVLGLFEPGERLVVLDKDLHPSKIPFVKLHEAGHGCLPHQSGLYALMQDCDQTLDPYTTDLFENEANVFATEVLFQGKRFEEEAHAEAFSVKVPMRLAKKFGASHYASFRRYVNTSPNPCCLIVLEKPVWKLDGTFRADIRRIVPTRSFHKFFDAANLGDHVDSFHMLADAVPRQGKRMSFYRTLLLTDRNGATQYVTAEAFFTGHNVLVLLKPKESLAVGFR
jgi:hypothetical protein